MPLAAVFSREVINNQTLQEAEDIFPLNLGIWAGMTKAVCHGRSRNRLSHFTKNCNFERSLIQHNRISPEKKLNQLRAHFS